MLFWRGVDNKYINMEVLVENSEPFTWNKVEETLELAFQQHPHANSVNEDLQTKIQDFHNCKKTEHEDAVYDNQIYPSHYQPNKEIFEGNHSQGMEPKFTAKLQGTFDVDQANATFMTIEKSFIPTITVKLTENIIREYEEVSEGKDWKLVVEVLFAEKSSIDKENFKKYKIYKGGLNGITRKKYNKSQIIEFKNLKVSFASSLDKNSKILIALFLLTEKREKIYKEILISKDLFIIEESKVMIIDSIQGFHQYFDLFGPEFMDKLPPALKITKADKHAFNEQIASLQKYLIKKNKKFLNIIYLSFKFFHFCQVYFKGPDDFSVQQFDQSLQMKRTILSAMLNDCIRKIQQISTVQSQKNELICNYINPNAKLIFKINANLRRVRIFMKKEYTEILSIVACDDSKQLEGFSKFQSPKQLKDFYIEYHTSARKCKSLQSSTKPIYTGNVERKIVRKAEDEQYHGEDGQEESQVEQGSNQNFSDRKKKDSMLKKLYTGSIPKKPPVVSPKESKYPTRNKIKADNQESQNNESKRHLLAKKAKQKEILSKKSSAHNMMPNTPLGVNGIGQMPFQVIPQGGTPIPGVFPMLNGQKKDGVSANGKGPQMIPVSIPGMQIGSNMNGMGYTGMNMGGMPNFGSYPGGMSFSMPNMSGVQMGIAMNNTGQKKEGGGGGGKDAKQDTNKGPIPVMMPFPNMSQMPQMLGMNPQMCMIPQMGGQMMPQAMMGLQGMGGMQLQGMQGMQIPSFMQGPNGQTIMVMQMPSQMMPQQSSSQSNQSSQNSNGQGQNGGNSSSNSANMPIGIMIPGGANGPNYQAMQGLQGVQPIIGGPGMQGITMMPQGLPMNQMAMMNLGNGPNGNGQLGMMMNNGMQNMPMSFMMPGNQNGVNQNDSKQKNTQNKANGQIAPIKKIDSAKKDQKIQNSVQIQGNNQKSAFLPGTQPQFPPNIAGPPLTKEHQEKLINIMKMQGGQNSGVQMVPGINPLMMSGIPSGGIVLTPQMAQQMMGQGMVQGNMIALTPETLAQMPLAQRQQIQMQMQNQLQLQMMNKNIPNGGLFTAGKKDQDKK